MTKSYSISFVAVLIYIIKHTSLIKDTDNVMIMTILDYIYHFQTKKICKIMILCNVSLVYDFHLFICP